MFPCSIEQLAVIVGGQMLTHASGASRNDVMGSVIRHADVDSRRVRPGSTFFAMAGSHGHGNDFAASAKEAGAVVIVTDRIPLQQDCRSVPTVIVPDSQAALTSLARWNRLQSPCRVVAITGSVGKTTTRQMLHGVVERHFQSIQSPANFNNELGLPLSLLLIDPQTQVAVLELAACRSGEIRQLAELAIPELAVVTRVAPAHVESFGSLDVIQSTKQELVDAISPHGRVFLNADDSRVTAMASAARCPVVTFGQSHIANIVATRLSQDSCRCHVCVDGQRFVWSGGMHLVTSVLATIAVCRELGLSDAQTATGIESFECEAGRGHIIRAGGLTIIDESYNASPASMTAAIEVLASIECQGRRVCIVGDMRELGAESDHSHRELGEQIVRAGIELVIFIGEETRHAHEAAKQLSAASHRILHFDSADGLAPLLSQLIEHNDTVVVKGSRALRLERIVSQLTDLAEAARWSHYSITEK